MSAENTKRANWLELLYDLIFVYAISKATHILAHAHNGHIGTEQYAIFILVMVPIWWAWTGHTLFATRFDTEDTGQKILTLSQMLVLVFWTSFINADFDPNYHGYLLFYVLIRVLLIMMYWRVARINPASILISKRLSMGFSMGLMVSLSSLWFDSPTRYFVMYAGIAIEILTPLLSRNILKTVSVKSHHLPERYGLLTIILLGESVIIMATKLNEVSWTIVVVGSAVLGFFILSAIWWFYFNRMEKNVVGQKMQTGQHIIYGHLFVYSGLSAIAVFIGYSIKNELTLLSHGMLFVTGFAVVCIGFSMIFGFKSMLKKSSLIPFSILILSAILIIQLQYNSQLYK
jgi:low temperature requirement protein LtrA